MVGAGGKACHAVADNDDRCPFREEAQRTARLAFLHNTQARTNAVVQQWPNNGREGCFGCLWKARKAFDDDRSCANAKIGIKGDIKETALNEGTVKPRIGQGKSRFMQRYSRIRL